MVVINGSGFDSTATNNAVRFTDAVGAGTVAASIVSATPNQIVATVPQRAGSGDVTITVGPTTSGARTFTRLPQTAAARAREIGSCALSAIPRSHVLLPDGRTAFVATPAGVSIVDTDPGSPNFCHEIGLPIAGGLDDVDVLPDGSWVYGISRSAEMLYAIDPINHTVPFALPVGTEPLGIAIGPNGRWAYIPTAQGTIQKWDVLEGSPTLRSQVGVISSPDPNLRGNAAIDPTGEILLALSGTGKMLAFETATGAFMGSVPTGPDPRDVVIDPSGLRAYVSDGRGQITIASLRASIAAPVNPFAVQNIRTGGSLRKASISPAGSHLFSANRELNLIDVVDLNPSSASYRTVVSTIPQSVNPVGVNLSTSGDYAYSIVEEDMKLVVLAMGEGPALKSISKQAGPEGAQLVLAGSGFGADINDVRVVFGDPHGTFVSVQPAWGTQTALGVAVPAGAQTGPVSVQVGLADPLYSNALHFAVLGPTPPPGQLRAVSRTQLELYEITPIAAMSPTGDQMIVGTEDGNLLFLDTDPSSPTLNQVIRNVDLGEFGTHGVYDIAMTPDGMCRWIRPVCLRSIATGPIASMGQ
ncbi:MAG: IPT/TIG domain-containing protein [Chitinivibrionia bacterium]|nr:IPT/TIG domain-containing protein [Chitinivibrionia bacterium]